MKLQLQSAQYYTLALGLIALLLVAALLVSLGMVASRSKITSSPVPLNTVKSAGQGNTTTRAMVQIAPEPDKNAAVQQVTIGGGN